MANTPLHFSTGKLRNAQPSVFHKLYKELENNHEVTIITQNIDSLHQKAGSSNVIELHGNKNEYECLKTRFDGCGKIWNFTDINLNNDETPLCKNCGKILKPNSSLYGEGVRDFGLSRDHIINSDVFIVAGTSLETGPANELPIYYDVRGSGISLWLNEVKPPIDYHFTHEIICDVQEITLEKLNHFIK